MIFLKLVAFCLVVISFRSLAAVVCRLPEGYSDRNDSAVASPLRIHIQLSRFQPYETAKRSKRLHSGSNWQYQPKLRAVILGLKTG